MLLLSPAGHIKANCYERKVNFIYDKFMEDFSKRKKRQQEKEANELTKDEVIKRQIKIIQKRAKEIEFELVKHEKRGVFEAKIKGLSIGKYIGPRITWIYSRKFPDKQFQLGTYQQTGRENCSLQFLYSI